MTAIARGSISPLLRPRPYRVVGKVDEVPGVVTLHTVPVDGDLPTFRPAQVAMLGAFGVGEAAISISSAVDERRHHAFTIRRAGPISGALVDTPVGELITVRSPFGTAWPIDRVDGGSLLVVGGGLGIAPLRALIHEAVDGLGRFDRVVIAYGATSPEQLIFLDDIERWRRRGAEVALTVDEADDRWTGPVGYVPELLTPELDLDWSTTTSFVCGPDVMMRVAADRLASLGMAVDRIWVTLERNMQCGTALCGHCQLGPFIVCRDGPVTSWADIAPFHRVAEL